MSLIPYYLQYVSEICEGTRKAPAGIVLTEQEDLKKALQLQAEITKLGIPAFVKACAEADGTEIPQEEYDSFDPAELNTAIAQLAAASQPQEPAEEAPQEPVRTETRDIFEIFLDSVCLDDALLTYLIDILKRRSEPEFAKLSHAAARTELKLDDFLAWLGNMELLAGEDEQACAAIMDKCLYRLEQEFKRYGLAITRQNMANWMIRLGEEYLGTMYDYLHKLLYDYHVIQADETPVLVNKDGRPVGSQSYMWVYRSGFMYRDRQIILYEYQKTRNASHPREFLRDYTGICVTDGYQVYHTLEKERENLKIAGCWVHCRRRFNDALEVIPKAHRKESILHLIMKQIQAIYREEGKLSDFSTEDRLMQRQLVVKPLVDAFFVYLKQNEPKIPKNGKIREAFTYALNQESYLKVFLEDGDVPIDNNASERAIRGFCIGKKNWEMIDTVNGANSSAIIYGIAETAKANNLKPFNYFEYLLAEIPKHVDDKNTDFLAELLPWSDMLPENIRKPQKASGK